MTYRERVLSKVKAPVQKKEGYVRILKFNPNHEPGGSSKGGQFAKKPGGASSSVGGGKVSLGEYASTRSVKSLTKEDVLSHFTKEERQEIADKEAQAHREPLSVDIWRNPDGSWKDDRKALHDQIINHFLSPERMAAATPKAGERPTFIVLGGRGGSGKSAFSTNKDGTQKIREFDDKKFIKLDSDEIKEWLKPPYAGYNAFNVHDESSYLFDRLHGEAAKRGLNVLHDITMKSERFMSDVSQMKKAGYRIEGYYMFTSRQVAANRVVKRYLGSGPGDRHRLVPVEVALKMVDNEKNFDKAKRLFDNWSAYDNNGPDGPTLIDRKGRRP